MRSSATHTVTETSNRRQPVRQTRTNPSRNAATMARPVAARGSIGGTGESSTNGPGFFPAITHFSDSISALPKEMVRHYTMLKEVDAKIYAPAEALDGLVAAAIRAPIPPSRNTAVLQTTENDLTKEIDPRISGLVGLVPQKLDSADANSQPEGDAEAVATEFARRTLFQNLRMVMGEMLLTLDEKNHVLATATDALSKQLARCNSSYPAIEDEISEEARYGNLNHWAYTHKTTEKKGTTAGERTRRDAAAANSIAATAAVHESDLAASRSELRREAVAASRKQRNQQIDSDFDDNRNPHVTARKSGPGKGRKPADTPLTTTGGSAGLGVGNSLQNAGSNVPNKRRKIEKQVVSVADSATGMERSMSMVYGKNVGHAKGRPASPRDTPTAETTKKRPRGGMANGVGRRRAGTANSNLNSPSMASSPVVGTFSTAKVPGANSPIPSALPRSQPSRGRQNSSHSVVQETSKNRPSSAALNKPMNGNGMYGSHADVEKVAGLTGRSVGDVKSSMKEAVISNGDHLVEDVRDKDGDLRGGILVGSVNVKGQDKSSLKREEPEVTSTNGSSRSRAERPPSISTSAKGTGRQSKTATPVTGHFSEPQRPRSSRTSEPTLKRSHKKGAGLAAQMAAAAAAAEEETTSTKGDADEDEDDDDGEPRYCYCNQVSYGEMVACDASDCAREWFHLDCVGLSKAPTKNAKWYCDECKENVKKGKVSSASSSR